MFREQLIHSHLQSGITMYFVTRYIDGQLTGYAADNWNHVACLIAVGKVVSVLMPNGTLRTF